MIKYERVIWDDNFVWETFVCPPGTHFLFVIITKETFDLKTDLNKIPVDGKNVIVRTNRNYEFNRIRLEIFTRFQFSGICWVCPEFAYFQNWHLGYMPKGIDKITKIYFFNVRGDLANSVDLNNKEVFLSVGNTSDKMLAFHTHQETDGVQKMVLFGMQIFGGNLNKFVITPKKC